MSISVSVIIPAFNSEAFLEAAIDSALAQTLPSIETLVIDDGSTDRTAEIASSFGNSVKVITSTNQGVAAARNIGITQSTGDFVAFLDSDDIWEPTKLERQLDFVDEATRFIYTDTVSFGPESVAGMRMSAGTQLPSGKILRQLVERNFIATSSVLLDRKIAQQVGGFDSALAVCEDWDMWLRVASCTTTRYVDEPLVKYRIRPGSQGSNLESRIAGARRVIESGLDMLGLAGRERARLKMGAMADCYAYAALLADLDNDSKTSRKYRWKALTLQPSVSKSKEFLETLLTPRFSAWLRHFKGAK